MTAACGTYAALMRHRRNEEQPDEACLQAGRDYVSQLRQRPDALERARWWPRTRSRALQRLAAECPERLAELVAEERSAEGWPSGAEAAS